MLYAAALDAAGRLYDAPALRAKAGRLRAVIREQAFDGRFFVDNAVRAGGRLRPTGHRTEVCQYYAFFFDVAAPEAYPALWETLLRAFGPGRKATGAFPEVHPAGMLNGYYLRLELLVRYGCLREALADVRDYFLSMAERTGTLWEHDAPSASCCHGFASYVVQVLYRAALGLRHVDLREKTVHLRPGRTDLAFGSGRLPVGAGVLDVAWRTEGERVSYRVQLPPGFSLRIDPGEVADGSVSFETVPGCPV
jgi:hypothetical protein